MRYMICFYLNLESSIAIYIILLYPDNDPTTVRSNDTLGNTPFQLINDFFHVTQGVLSMLSKLPPGVCWRGGGQQAC